MGYPVGLCCISKVQVRSKFDHFTLNLLRLGSNSSLISQPAERICPLSKEQFWVIHYLPITINLVPFCLPLGPRNLFLSPTANSQSLFWMCTESHPLFYSPPKHAFLLIRWPLRGVPCCIPCPGSYSTLATQPTQNLILPLGTPL